MKQSQDKLFRLGDNLGMVVCGDSGDTVYFGEYIQKNLALYRIRNGYSLSPSASANFTRYEMAKRLREKPNLVNLIMEGLIRHPKRHRCITWTTWVHWQMWNTLHTVMALCLFSVFLTGFIAQI